MKRHFITFLLMFLPMMVVGQVIAEADFTTATEFTGWTQFDDSQTDGKVELGAEGLEITVGVQTGQLWQPQVMVIGDGSFDLKKDGNYLVLVNAKFPTAGTLQINMGSWSANDQARFRVEASNNFQTIQCVFEGWSVNASGSHLLFHPGDFKGTTIIKKITVIDLANLEKWSVAGDRSILGTDWDVTNKNNMMYSRDGENYTLTKSELALSKGTYQFKVFKDNSTNVSYPSSNASLVINEDGVYNVYFTFNANTKTVSATAMKVEVWTIAGDKSLLGSDWDATDIANKMIINGANYILTKSNLTLPKGTYQFKVFKDYAQTESYPSSNATIVIEENATYTIKFTFNPKTKELSATATKTDGLYFNYIPKGKVAELIQNPKGYKGTIIIPSTVTHEGVEYTVTKISDNTFSNSNVTSVTIPNSITSIGNGAFNGCRSLTSVTIPNSVTFIGSSVFYGCTGLTSVTIPNSVTSIGESAFSGCTGLTSVTIPNSVTSIGMSAFSGCTGLTSVTIPNSVTSIGSSVFFGCTGLTSVTIPNSVTSIDPYVFYGCTGLTSVTIPNSVTSIGNFAFYGCSGLTSVTIGESANWIDSYAFGNCKKLSDVYCLAENVPSSATNAFMDSYIEYSTLHVSATSLSSYSNKEPWKNFMKIVAIGSGEIPQTQKCATPTIKFENGKIKFSCTTEGAEFVSTITPVGNNMKYDSEIVINNTYKVTVYATKAGYNNSDVATIEIQANSGVKGDVNGDGEVNVADHVELSNIIFEQDK